MKSGRQDLNLRPPHPQYGALPSCATPRIGAAAGFSGAAGHCTGWWRGWQFWGCSGAGRRAEASSWASPAAQTKPPLDREPPHPSASRPPSPARGEGPPAASGCGGWRVHYNWRTRRSSATGALLSSVCGNQGGNVPNLFEVAPRSIAGCTQAPFRRLGSFSSRLGSAGAISDDCRRIRCEERRLIQWPRPKRTRSSRT